MVIDEVSRQAPSETPSDAGPTDGGRRLPTGFRALGHGHFRLYFVGMLFRGTAVWMQLVGLPWYVIELGATPLDVGIVLALQSLPFLFISPLGGVIADRTDRAAVLMLAQVGVCIQAAVMFAVIWTGTGSIPIAALLGAIAGCFIAFELPVRQAYLTELVPSRDISSAVSLHSTAFNSTRFVGPAIAGILIATVGVAAVFAVAALMALGSALTTRFIERTRERRPRAPAPDVSIGEAFLQGARFSYHEPRVRAALLLVAGGSVFGIQAFQTLAPLFVDGTLGLDGGGYGAFMAIWGGGAIVMTYLVTAVAQGDRRAWLVRGGAGLAIMLGALSVTTSTPLAFALAAAIGASQISLIQNALITVQTSVSDELRGRVLGFYTTLLQGTAPLGALIAGALASVIGVRNAMVVAAIALGAVVLVTAVAMPARPARTATADRA